MAALLELAVAEGPLQGLELRLAPGERLAVVAGAGAGKSELLRLLASRARVDGHELARCTPGERLRLVARVPAEPAAMLSGVTPSVRHEVAWTLENLGLERGEMARRVEAALARTGLAALRERSPWELSGGQQQRLALACGLVLEPRVLLLDEPGALLDPQGVVELAALLEDWPGAVVWATARCEEVAWCGRWLVLEEGFREGRAGAAAGRALGPSWVRLAQAAAGRGLWDGPLPGREEELAERWRAAPQALPSAAPGGAPLADLREVSCGDALRGVTLRVGAGERVALLGGNGAGKTTLALALTGLLLPETGQVLLGGEETGRLTPAELASRATLLFQDPRSQIFCPTVREEVAFGPVQLGWPAERVDAAVQRALALAEVEAPPERAPLDLPPWELRWVALASVLALEAPLVILDEPSAGLDGPGRERLERVLAALRQRGTAVVLITHDLELAADQCERAVVLAEGRVWADGPLGEVFGGPEPPPALRFPVAGRVARALGLPGEVCSTVALLERVSV